MPLSIGLCGVWCHRNQKYISALTVLFVFGYIVRFQEKVISCCRMFLKYLFKGRDQNERWFRDVRPESKGPGPRPVYLTQRWTVIPQTKKEDFRVPCIPCSEGYKIAGISKHLTIKGSVLPASAFQARDYMHRNVTTTLLLCPQLKKLHCLTPASSQSICQGIVCSHQE